MAAFRCSGRGEVFYHLTYIDDLVRGFAVVRPGAGRGRPHLHPCRRRHTRRSNELVGLIATELEVSPPRLHLPVWPVWIAGALCEPFACRSASSRRFSGAASISTARAARSTRPVRARSWATIRPSTSNRHSPDRRLVPFAGVVVSRPQTERRPHLRSPGMGRVAHARRQAAVRVDDPALRREQFNGLADQPAQARSRRTTRSTSSGSTSPTCIARSSIPATLPALLKELERRQADVVHLHGYGASTFGRLAAAIRHIPVVLHEHANLTDTPWFQKVADRMLAPATDIAIAVSQSTADFMVAARLIPAERTKVVYLGRAARRVQPRANLRRSGRGPPSARHTARRVRDRHRHAADAVQGQRVPRRSCARASSTRCLRRGSTSSARGSCSRRSRPAPRRSSSASGWCSRASDATWRKRSRRSTFWCSRRSGRGRRSPCSKRWRWGRRSFQPMPTASRTC